MATEVIIVMIAVIVLALVFNGIEDYSKDTEVMSFREAMDLAELPVVTFYQGKEKFNFLLDTGSNHSHISQKALDRIKGEEYTGSLDVSGVGGNAEVNKALKVVLEYKKNHYEALLFVGEHLDPTFKSIKESTGVTIHGIIGNSFLNENKYVLDFDDLIAYKK